MCWHRPAPIRTNKQPRRMHVVLLPTARVSTGLERSYRPRPLRALPSRRSLFQNLWAYPCAPRGEPFCQAGICDTSVVNKIRNVISREVRVHVCCPYLLHWWSCVIITKRFLGAHTFTHSGCLDSLNPHGNNIKSGSIFISTLRVRTTEAGGNSSPTIPWLVNGRPRVWTRASYFHGLALVIKTPFSISNWNTLHFVIHLFISLFPQLLL